MKPFSTQENKHGIGPDRNKVETAHGLSVPIFCSSVNLYDPMIKSCSIFNFFHPAVWIIQDEKESDPIRCLFSGLDKQLHLKLMIIALDICEF